MALTISQIASVSYAAVLAEKRQAANQWAESAFLHELDKQGGIEVAALGPTIQAPLDYRRNTGTVIHATDLTSYALTKTEVITAAVYDVVEITSPIVWSKKDEAMNPSEKQKIAFVKNLLVNGIESHDDIIESAFFTTSNGFNGFNTHIVDAGTGSDGGIDSSVETWWKNKEATYVDDTDIESAFTTVWNACAKGSGSKLQPTLMVSDGATQATFEGTQQAQQRYETQELRAGFKTLMFKTARYVFSPYGGTRVLFLNPKNYKFVVGKGYFRDLEETEKIPNANGYTRSVYTAGQTIVNNRSRLGVAHL